MPTDFLGYPILDEYQETIVHSDGFHIFFLLICKRLLKIMILAPKSVNYQQMIFHQQK